MVSKHRLGLAVLTALSAFFLLFGLIVIWKGWFLPEPQYTTNSFDDVRTQEISLSVINLLINVVILFVPIYTISLFFKSSQQLFAFKRFLIILISVLLLSSVFIARTVYESLQFWQPLEASTRSMNDRTFTRGRGGGLGLQKIYFIDFTTKGSNLSFIQNEIIPILQSYGYTAHDFGLSIGRKHYTTFTTDIPSDDMHIENLNQVPFTTRLSPLDYANINFQNKKSYGSLNLRIDNYKGSELIKGSVRAYY